MTIHVLSDVELWFAEHRLRGVMNSLALNDGVDLQEATVFGDVGKRRVAALHDTELSFEGFVDNSGFDKALYDQIAVANVPVTVAPQGSSAGARAYLLQLLAGEYTPGGAVGETFGFSLSGSSSSGKKLAKGVIAHNAVVTIDGQGASQQLGAIVAGTSRLDAHLHVLGFTNGNPTTFTIESDDNPSFTSATTRLTFATVTAVGSQHLQLLTSVTDTYWRARWDVPAAGGPSVSFVMSFGINPVF